MKFKLNTLTLTILFFSSPTLCSYQAEHNDIQLIVPKVTKLIPKQKRMFFYSHNIKPLEISLTNNNEHAISFNLNDVSLKLLSTDDLESIIRKHKLKQIIPYTGLGISLLLTINTILNHFALREITNEDLKDILKSFPFLKTNVDILSDKTIRLCTHASIALQTILCAAIGRFSLAKLLKNRNAVKMIKKINNQATNSAIVIEPGETVPTIALVKKNNVKDFTLTVHSQNTNETTLFEVNLAPTR